MFGDTIAAIATAFGEGAIALLRLSGPDSLQIADAVFRGRKPVTAMPARRQHFGSVICDGRKLDDVLLTVFRSPHSYTGEDVVELSCHGGVLVTRRILELVLSHGARAAEPGEFTKRAFLNGKMDLTQAEAVMDLITAQTDLALRAANEQLEGRLGARMRALRQAVLELLANVEAQIDFPEEDIAPEADEALLGRLNAICRETAALLETATHGRVLREGVRTVIFGAPNVGKSSLLNLLLGYERAIVSPKPGTTRDVIEEVINLRGIPLRLIDTAGIRESADEVEQQGIERTRRQIARADLVLHIADASVAPAERLDPRRAAGEEVEGEPKQVASEILVLNKSDLVEHPGWAGVDAARISCLDRSGIPQLEELISARIFGGSAAHRDWALAISARHKACLDRAERFLSAAHAALVSGAYAELVAEELRGALEAIGDVVGRVESDEVLGQIFSTFCIGK